MGKSSAAKILCNKIAPNNTLYINGSDETGVDTVRNKIIQFASAMSFDGIKIVHITEADYLSPNSQGILRDVLETYSKTTRFIFTLNYHEKIIPAIKSRCQTFKFEPMSTKQMVKYAATILQEENIDYEPEDVLEIIKKFKPDIRKIINTLQQNVSKDKLVIDKRDLIENNFKVAIMDSLSDNNAFKKIRQIIANNNINQFEEVYQYMFDNIHKVINDKNELLDCYIKISEYLYRDSLVADKEINFMGMIADLVG